MIVEYGMSEKLGPMQFGTSQGQVFLGRDIGHEQNYSDQIAYEIDQEMQRFIRECYEKCKQLLTDHAKEVHLIANTLLEVETLELDQIKSLIETGSINSGGGNSDDEGSSEGGEPTVDNIGDVKVRIQGKEEGQQPLPTEEIPNNPMDDESRSSEDEERKDPPSGSDKGSGGPLA